MIGWHMVRALFCLTVFSAGSVFGAQLILPSDALERDGMVHVVFRTSPLATGRGVLSIDWTDVHGRVVDHRSLPVELIDETDAGFDIDLRRARGMQNELRAHLIFDGQDKKGRPDHRDEEASRPFIAKPPMHSWWDYEIIMWQPLQRRTVPKVAGAGN